MAQVQAITADVQQIANTYQLGAPQAEFTYKTGRLLSTGLIFVVLGIVGIIFIIFNEHISLETIDFSDVDSGGGFWVVTILGLFFIAFGAYTLINVVTNIRTRVLLFENGIVRLQGVQPYVIRWDQVDAFWQSITRRYTNGIYTGTTHIYTLRRSDGAMFKFNDTLSKVEQLGTAIQRGITVALLPRYIMAYKAGNTLTFGPLTIDRQGIGNGKERLSWNEVKDLQVRRGRVAVQKAGKWLNWSSAPVAKIPNFYVFMTLTDNITHNKI